jgi:small-conductance mechanosensitive channel
LVFFVACALVAAGGFATPRLIPGLRPLASGLTWPELIGLVASVMGITGLFTLATHLVLARRNKPPVEGAMVARLYWLVGALAVIGSLAYGFGVLTTFGTVFSLFGGMLLGWSLQAPVSGFAAWILVSLKRPFRPGDRVQFPSLGLTGDVKDIGAMYMVLNQVGGSIGSEEAVGRHILVPNAMLFGQVVINYTVLQEAPYMLDEVVVRITYDSDWEAAEKILLEAANRITGDVIKATGEKPYMRADLYDYGVYLRLRYLTGVKNRAETSYGISKLIFEDIQRTPSVDIAIPYVYSYRAGQDRKTETEEALKDKDALSVKDIDVARIADGAQRFTPQDVEQLAGSIQVEGLLQPIVIVRNAATNGYNILAGHMRFEACKKLGWKTVPAIIRNGA